MSFLRTESDCRATNPLATSSPGYPHCHYRIRSKLSDSQYFIGVEQRNFKFDVGGGIRKFVSDPPECFGTKNPM